MNVWRLICERFLAVGVALMTSMLGAFAAQASKKDLYLDVPMPPGFQVIVSELEGPVFADATGKTLYTWPQRLLRNGYSGEPKGRIECYDIVRRESAGLMSPYPPGVLLPELETRPSCTDLWHPVLADEDAAAVGRWSIVVGDDDRRQWAYEEQPLYTSHLDRGPGDTIGGTRRPYGGEGPAVRYPIGPPPNVPPGLAVFTTALGGLLETKDQRSLYAYDGDTLDKITCIDACLQAWEPLVAPALARAEVPWSIIERPGGVRQWAYRDQPLYTYANDRGKDYQVGTDVDGWHNIYTFKAPSPPASFTRQDTIAGGVLADRHGRTIYLYSCGDDSQDQLSCDHPSDLQVYRLAVCGNGDPERCARQWPYVEAGPDEVSTSGAWSLLWIDPQTGRHADGERPGLTRVWAYRGRPVYTFYLDERPGDVRGDAVGEWRGGRNGLRAFWIRNAFYEG